MNIYVVSHSYTLSVAQHLKMTMRKSCRLHHLGYQHQKLLFYLLSNWVSLILPCGHVSQIKPNLKIKCLQVILNSSSFLDYLRTKILWTIYLLTHTYFSFDFNLVQHSLDCQKTGATDQRHVTLLQTVIIAHFLFRLYQSGKNDH